MSKVKGPWSMGYHFFVLSHVLLSYAVQLYLGSLALLSVLNGQQLTSLWTVKSLQFLKIKRPHNRYTTQGDYDGRAVIILWLTNMPAPSEVLHAKFEHNYDHIAQGKTTNYTYYDYKSGYIHHTFLDSLEFSLQQVE